MAEDFCKELKVRLDVFVTADKYDFTAFKNSARTSFMDLLPNYWTCAKVLDVLEQLIDGPAAKECDLSRAAMTGLAERITMFRPSDQVAKCFAPKHHEFAPIALNMFLTGAIPQASDSKPMGYCPKLILPTYCPNQTGAQEIRWAQPRCVRPHYDALARADSGTRC